MNHISEVSRDMQKQPLSRREFRKKYWADGQLPNQIHTMEIEDGETEKEQLIINDINGLVEWFFELKRDDEKLRKEMIHEIEKKGRMVNLISIMASVIFTVLMCWASKK